MTDMSGACERSRDSIAFTLSVEMASGGRHQLAFLASALHRRGVDPVTARLQVSGDGSPVFDATFMASRSRAQVVESAMSRLVDVVSVSLAQV